MKLVISIDVEEDGLFCGRYPTTPNGVTNVRDLSRLDFLRDQFGIPLTLLTSYPVACDAGCAAVLKRQATQQAAEIGAHLHPWCTPPFTADNPAQPTRTAAIPEEILRAKLGSLMAAISERTGIKPTSFRAGRFDLSQSLLRQLPDFGISTDSSVVPLQRRVDGPEDHFAVPSDPFPHPLNPSVLEVPLTVVAVCRSAADVVANAAPKLPPAW